MTHATSRGLSAVLAAQFLSALADNALLFAAIALLKAGGAPDWQMPLLQEFFVLAFIVLAPFVGSFADGWSKGRVMLLANALKLLGALGMLMGLPPLVCYGIVGIGAAAYSPAKYGILGELVPAQQLVKANGLMEGSTIVAILLGAVAGGALADHSPSLALAVIAGAYALAAVANLLIPHRPAAHPLTKWSPVQLVKDFWRAAVQLGRQPDARFSLMGTGIFWGAGSTLRFLLVAWVPVALSITDTRTPANLSGVVAVGIALGAAAAARFIRMNNVMRVLPAGLLIGVLIGVLAVTTNLVLAGVLLVLIGACGGFYVVPLNALLQEKGHETVGAGHAIAVQNFIENTLMLLMVGGYTWMTQAGVPVVTAAAIFGGVVFAGISMQMLLRRSGKGC